jgi:hypothetical protein
MQKWEYAHAIYKDGMLDPHIGEGLAEIGHDSVGAFLDEAGKRGWELCCALPYPSLPTSKPDGAQAVIFKRPAISQEKVLAHAGGRKFR